PGRRQHLSVAEHPAAPPALQHLDTARESRERPVRATPGRARAEAAGRRRTDGARVRAAAQVPGQLLTPLCPEPQPPSALPHGFALLRNEGVPRSDPGGAPPP